MTADRFIADLTLDLVDGEGRICKPIDIGSSRVMAFAFGRGGMWYGFVVSVAPEPRIVPGTTVRVALAFLDERSALDTFPAGASALFGDGVSSRGVIVRRG